jgi:flagellar export protein FliJ
MKPFRFSLQPLLVLRQRREQEAMESYAHALFERAQAMDQMQAAETRLQGAHAEWQQQAQAGGWAAHLARLGQHYESLARRRDEHVALVGAAERKTQASLKEMLIARQQREAVEKCLARQRQAHELARQRLEQKFLDDLAQKADSGISSALTPTSTL